MERFTREDLRVGEAPVRERMRARARHFRTPEWLDHSFVMPDDQTPPVVAAHSAPVVLPRPRAEQLIDVPLYERPTTPQVDFAAVVRRSDARRAARLVTAVGLVVALLAVVVFQATEAPLAAGCAVLAALIAVTAAVVRLFVDRAPVPYLEG